MSTIVVNNPTDMPVVGEIDLRQAIVQANTNGGVETITFDKTVFKTPQTISLTGGQLELSDTTGTVTITGPNVGVTVSGDGLSRVFEVEAGVTASISGMTITGGSAPGGSVISGGGLANYGGTTTLTNCTVSGNSASVGGGLYTNSAGTTTLTNCTISGNSAEWDGGLENVGTTTLRNCTVSGNSAAVVGGGLGNFFGGTMTLTNCTVSGNSATGGGGGVVNSASSLTVEHSTFDANHAVFGGAVENTTDYSDNVPEPDHIALLDSSFTGNSAGDTGGAVSNSGGSGSISGCQFSGNRAGSTGGGGISVYAGALTIANTTIAGNSSAGEGGGLLVFSGNGFQLATATLTNCTVSGNSAVAGGGISNLGTLSVANSNISKNEALGNAAGGGFGGGIEDDSSGVLTVSGSTFDANLASAVGPNDPIVSPSYVFASGGAIDLNLASTGLATITSSRFVGNEAKGGSPGASAGGGAISNSSNVGATLTVTDCSLRDNAAIGAADGDGTTNFGSGQGGGINSIGTLTVRDSTLTDNLAQGAPLAADVVPSQSVLSNSATAGGGIFCLDLAGGPVVIADSTLSGNEAVGGSGSAPAVAEGGGISLILVPSGLVTGCTVADNVARGGAGGSGVAGAAGVSGGVDVAVGSVVTVESTTLAYNQAIGGAGGSGAAGGEGVGGGINVGTGVILGFTDDSSLTLTDSTLVGNQAVGGAGGSGSTGGNGLGGGISVLAGSSASVDSTLIVFNAALGGAGGTGGSNGQGQGGGLYIGTTANVTLDTSTVVLFNDASTSGDNIFGTYTIS